MSSQSGTSKNTEEVINHYGSVRLRLNGSGDLKMTLFSLDDVKNNILVPIIMRAATNIEPTRLSNFTQQRAYLELKVTGFEEYFAISKVVIFVKPVAKSYPGY